MVLGFDFDRLRSGPFEGPAIVKPPALPGDTYFYDKIGKVGEKSKGNMGYTKYLRKEKFRIDNKSV